MNPIEKLKHECEGCSNCGKIVYHGSDVEVKNPRFIFGKFTKDFGRGFYVTEIKRQAENWSIKLGREVGVVSEYVFHITENAKIKKFGCMDDKWLDFVANCRYGKPHDYDIVEGPIADDAVYRFVEDYLNGEISRESFWSLCKFR